MTDFLAYAVSHTFTDEELAAHDREVAAKALRDASTGTLAWIVKPTPDGEWTSVARWLRTRADRIEKGE